MTREDLIKMLQERLSTRIAEIKARKQKESSEE